MTTDELYNEFNLVYNNLASNLAPGLDKYEISVYLTKAQDSIVDSLYSEFEKSEEVRRKLANLVVTKKLNIHNTPLNNIIYPEYTTVYELPNDVRYIVDDQLKMNNSADKCIKGKYIKVQPCLHDEVDTIVENPYRFNIRRGLRLDNSDDNQKTIEILTKDKHIEYYQIRYIQNPKPVILEDLTDESINGYTQESNGSLATELHRLMIEVAAQLAYQNYKQ